MATFVNINESPPQYSFLDAKCIGRKCFHPISNGVLPCCNNRKFNGCPDPLPEFDKERAERNKAAGWRLKK